MFLKGQQRLLIFIIDKLCYYNGVLKILPYTAIALWIVALAETPPSFLVGGFSKVAANSGNYRVRDEDRIVLPEREAPRPGFSNVFS